MLRERLKDMDLRITELADYLQISRPTMYKFIDYFDNNEFSLINKKVLKLFNYITENELAGKTNVVSYILNNLVDIKELDENNEIDCIKKLKKIILNNPDSKKSQFLKIAVSTSKFDDLLFYIVEVNNLLSKKKITPLQEEKIKLYNQITEKIKELTTKEEK